MTEKMVEKLSAYAQPNRDPVYALLRRYFAKSRPFLLQSDLREEFAAPCHEHGQANLAATHLGRFVERLQEGGFQAPCPASTASGNSSAASNARKPRAIWTCFATCNTVPWPAGSA